jgi:hypothetical protein
MAKVIRACIALAILLSALPAKAFAQSSKPSFPCQDGKRNLPDAIDIRDNEHAKAVMHRHAELKALPGYLDESVEGDYLQNTRTAQGRQALVIVVVVDSSDPETGRTTLAKAEAQAPRSVEDVGVRIVGGGGIWALPGGLNSEIIAPTDQDTVKGVVRIVTSLTPFVIWVSVHIDDNLLASSQPSERKDWETTICANWNSRTVPNGPHTISVKSYSSDMQEIPTGPDQISVTVAN